MKFNVTRAHITLGEIGSLCSCPVALAIKERLREGVSLAVRGDSVVFYRVTRTTADPSFELPGHVTEFVHHFDRRYEVSPFAFELELPDELLEPS